MKSNDEALNAVMKARIQEAQDDPRPSIAMDEVFDRLERKHAERMKA